MSSRFYVFKICEKLQLPESSGSSSFWRVSQPRAATNHIVATSLGSSAARIRQRHHTSWRRTPRCPAAGLPASQPTAAAAVCVSALSNSLLNSLDSTVIWVYESHLEFNFNFDIDHYEQWKHCLFL